MIHDYPLPYDPDSSLLFRRIRHLKYPLFLDSCNSGNNHKGNPQSTLESNNRFDLITAQPSSRFLISNQRIHFYKDELSISDLIIGSNPLGTHPFSAHLSSPSTVMTRLLNRYQQWANDYQLSLFDEKLSSDDIPYTPGLYGYLSYDAGQYLDSSQISAQNDFDFPEAHFGFYPWVIVVDHFKKTCWWRTIDPDLTPDKILQDPEPLIDFAQCSSWQSNLSQSDYDSRFNCIKEFIQAGDCYQVNFAQRFESEFQGDPLEGYLRLRKNCPAPFAAYIESPFGTILSLSPERFITTLSGKAITQPIKGTTPREADREADLQARNRLENSAKDRAENLMITDLLRNDFGKLCVPGSVSASPLFAIESFPNVHHMVSTVTGELNPNVSPLDLLGACFPGGSITGAPKLRAMQIINSLEPNRRHIYCGSIVHAGLGGFLTSNITIRTLLHHQKKLYCWAGGGIVADSTNAGEYQETFDKVNALLTTLGTF